jgi:hypothetical protein
MPSHSTPINILEVRCIDVRISIRYNHPAASRSGGHESSKGVMKVGHSMNGLKSRNQKINPVIQHYQEIRKRKRE